MLLLPSPIHASFIHSANIYRAPTKCQALLGTGESSVNKIDKILAIGEFTFQDWGVEETNVK